jgi:hypothetical protein
MRELLLQKERQLASVLRRLRAAESKVAALERNQKLNEYPNLNECGHTLCWEQAISNGDGKAVVCQRVNR